MLRPVRNENKPAIAAIDLQIYERGVQCSDHWGRAVYNNEEYLLQEQALQWFYLIINMYLPVSSIAGKNGTVNICRAHAVCAYDWMMKPSASRAEGSLWRISSSVSLQGNGEGCLHHVLLVSHLSHKSMIMLSPLW